MRSFLVVFTIITFFSSACFAEDLSCDLTGISQNKKYSNYQCTDLNGDGNLELTALYLTKSGLSFQYAWNSQGQLLSAQRVSSRKRKKSNNTGSVGSSTLEDVCTNISSLSKGQVWKSRQSPHIPRSDPRSKSTALITLRGTTPPSSKCLIAYDSDGNQIHKLGAYYPPGSSYSARHYGGGGCGDKKSPSTVARIAKARTGKTSIYLKIKSNQCVEVPNPTKCYNSIGC